jgi:hypothetical protein
VYLIVAFGKENGRILNYSAKTPDFFGYEPSKFKFIPTIEELMPPMIATKHQIMLNNFFKRGKSNYFKSNNMNLIRLKNEYLDNVDFLFDINY